VEKSLAVHRKVDVFLNTPFLESSDGNSNTGTIPLFAPSEAELGQKSYKQLQTIAKRTGACKANVKYEEMLTKLCLFYEARANQPWPACGAIVFRDIEFSYSPALPSALRLDRLDIGSGEKLGIVGPPGSGKSTFVNLLFRLGPLTSGSIFIDGVDISHLNLDVLRRSIGIVPQEPTLFRGTLFENLGNSSNSDEEVLTALQMFGFTVSKDALHIEISESLSMGQKQIIAAARALLRKPKVPLNINVGLFCIL
jgi:ABC-type multidrug transport system fused ATPase/permease subunit